MMAMFRNERVTIQPQFCIVLAFALLVVPVRWILGWFGAVIFHEVCHYVTIRLFGVPVYHICISTLGVNMQTGEMSTFQEIICALAGPLGGFILLLLLHKCPYISLCALGQSVFNLLPIYPLDGGRAITGILILLFGNKTGLAIRKIISVFLSSFLAYVSLIISLRFSLGLAPVVLAIYVIIRIVKIPCKERKLIVQ